MQKYADVVLDQKGNAMPNASVTVKTLAGDLATIYSDNNQTVAQNPLTTDTVGRFSFYANDGRYTLEIYIGGKLYAQQADILLEDPQSGSPYNINGGTIQNVTLSGSALSNVTVEGQPLTGADLAGYQSTAQAAAQTATTQAAAATDSASRAAQSAATALSTVNDFTRPPIVQTFTVQHDGDTLVYGLTDYAMGTNALQVMLNGVDQTGAYSETSTTSITFSEGLHAGDTVVIRQVGKVPVGTLPATAIPYSGRTVSDKLGDIVSVKDFGAKGDGVTDDTSAIQNAINYANANDVVLVIPNTLASYKITSNIALPRRVICQGKFSGGMTLTLTTTKNAVIDGLSADNVTLNGVWYGKFTNWKLTGNLLIQGYSSAWGTFWNYFDNILCNKLTLDVTQFAINQNHFKGINPSTTTDYGIRLTASGGTYECHGNLFEACDVSHSLGILNDAPNQQTNYLRQFYCEGGASIKGSFNIGVSGGVFDSQAPANVGMFNHIMGMVDHIQRTNADSISMGRDNLIDGGNWDHLNSIGAPVGISTFGITGAVVTDATDPSGIGKKYGGNATGTFQGISVTLRPTPNQRASLVGFWYGDLPEAVSTVASGLTETYYTPGSVFTKIGTSSWYIFRLSPICGNNVNTTLKFYTNAGTANNKNSYISGIFASPWKAAMFPYLGRDVINNNGAITIFGKTRLTGQYGVPYIAASPTTYTVNFPQAFASGVTPTVNVTPVPSSGYAGKLTSYEVTAVTNTGFTIVLKYPVDWTGSIHWSAEA